MVPILFTYAMRPAVVLVGVGSERVILDPVWLILNVVAISTVVAAVPIVQLDVRLDIVIAPSIVDPEL